MNERAYTRGNGINRGDINQTGWIETRPFSEPGRYNEINEEDVTRCMENRRGKRKESHASISDRLD